MTEVIAHRGLHLTMRENTVEAFAAAVACGVAGIELDARRTADGAIVVHHDAYLPDADGDGTRRAIVDCLRTDLPTWLPTIGDALDACAGVWVNIEIKNGPHEPDFDTTDAVATAVLAHLDDRTEPLDNWLISSFRRETVERCRTINPAVATAWLTAAPVSPADIEALAAGGHAALHPLEQTLDAATVGRCHAAGLRVNAWTCNDPARAAALAGWGVDGICTDAPAALLEALDANAG